MQGTPESVDPGSAAQRKTARDLRGQRKKLILGRALDAFPVKDAFCSFNRRSPGGRGMVPNGTVDPAMHSLCFLHCDDVWVALEPTAADLL